VRVERASIETNGRTRLLLASKHTARFASKDTPSEQREKQRTAFTLTACHGARIGPRTIKKKEYVATGRIITYQHFQHNLKSAKEQNLYAMWQVTPQNKAL